MDTLERIWDNIYLRVLLIVAIVAFAFYILWKTQIAWASFLIAFLIAYLAEPIVARLEHTRIVPRWLSVALTMIIIVLFFVVGVILLGEVLAQLTTLPTIIAPLLVEAPAWLEQNSPPWLLSIFNENTSSVRTFFEEQRNALLFWVQGQTRQLVRGIGTFFGGVARSIVILVLTGFMIGSFSVIQESIYRLFPARRRPFAKELAAKLDKSVGGYVRAKILEALIVGVVVYITLYFIDVPKPAALAFIAGVLNPVPYLGPAVATIPAVLLALTESWQSAIITLIAMMLIQAIDGNVLGPLLLSQSVSIHPVTVLVSILAGGALFGFWGILIAIPVAAFVQLLYSDYYLRSNWYLGKEARAQAPPTAPASSGLEDTPTQPLSKAYDGRRSAD